jgi:two-component system chemotaxis response regulator CheY
MAKILIVDDSAFARNNLRFMVESGPHEVVGLAADGEQALELFRRLRPELVLLDYLMAGMNGETVLREMIAVDPGARVIMISGSGGHTVRERALQGGARCFIEKPCVKDDLLQVIELVMEH